MSKEVTESNKLAVLKFIKTPLSFELKVDPFDFIILLTIANYCDMRDGICKVPFLKLAKECHMGKTAFLDHVETLIERKLLKVKRIWKLNTYRLGDLIILSLPESGSEEVLTTAMRKRSLPDGGSDHCRDPAVTIEILEKELLEKEEKRSPKIFKSHHDVVAQMFSDWQRSRKNGIQ